MPDTAVQIESITRINKYLNNACAREDEKKKDVLFGVAIPKQPVGLPDGHCGVDVGIHVGDVPAYAYFGGDAGEFVHEGTKILEVNPGPDVGKRLYVATGRTHQPPAELP